MNQLVCEPFAHVTIRTVKRADEWINFVDWAIPLTKWNSS